MDQAIIIISVLEHFLHGFKFPSSAPTVALTLINDNVVSPWCWFILNSTGFMSRIILGFFLQQSDVSFPCGLHFAYLSPMLSELSNMWHLRSFMATPLMESVPFLLLHFTKNSAVQGNLLLNKQMPFILVYW